MSEIPTRPGSHLLLVADEARGVRLKSDLEFIGYAVTHILLDDSGLLSAPRPEIEDIQTAIIDFEGDWATLSQIVQDVRAEFGQRSRSLLIFTDERVALELDFSAGVTDFIVRPYSLREVEARLRLALWNEDRPDDATTVKVDNLVINTTRYEVRVDGNPINLTLKEYELLKHLVTHRGRVFTRAELLDNIWGYDYYGGMRTVDVHIRRLRSKLGTIGTRITTLRGVGYRFDHPG